MSKLLTQNGKILITSAGALAIESAGGGGYDITATVNEDGTQSLAIVDGQGGGTAKLQEKTISITQNGETTVVPDSEYDGLSKVKVETNVSESGGNTTTTLEINCIDEPDYGLPLLITYQTNNGKWYQAYNVSTMATDSGLFTLEDVLIGGMCIISIPVETTTFLTSDLISNCVNVEKIEVDNTVDSEDLTKVLVYKITGVNAMVSFRLLNS